MSKMKPFILKWQKIATCLALFAMALSFLAQTAPLWAKQVNGQYIEICSALGTRTISVDDNFNELPDQSPSKHDKKEHCTICLTTAQGITSPTSNAITTAFTFVKSVKVKEPETSQNQKAFTNKNAIRAPPQIS